MGVSEVELKEECGRERVQWEEAFEGQLQVV